jgi:hypothetical protein
MGIIMFIWMFALLSHTMRGVCRQLRERLSDARGKLLKIGTVLKLGYHIHDITLC